MPMLTRLLNLTQTLLNCDKTDALADRGRTRGGGPLTYSRHQRNRRTREDAHQDSRSQLQLVSSFFSCVAGEVLVDNPRSSARSTVVPPLTSICLLLLAQAMGNTDEFTDDEICEIFHVVPTHYHRLGLLLFGSEVIFSEIITNTNCHRAALRTLSLISIDCSSYSLAFLLIFQNSPYLRSSHTFPHALLEALDEGHGQHCVALFGRSDLTVREAEAMGSILFDLIVTAEMQKRREKAAVWRDRHLRLMLRWLMRVVSMEKSDDSDDELDLLRRP
ncbi:hypothetical protein R3P38DRAFT_3137177 [Favolaschia claudopus]|uniref:Uncharacterized protein n=1 Tax=Favolaschia claudopus TaxID=2862362 RepID=A0AAV9Z3K4_9AGAR